MATAGGIWGPAALRLLRIAVTNTTRVVRTKITNATKPLQGELQHIPVQSGYTGRQPIHPAALLRQQRRGARWFSGVASQNVNQIFRRFINSTSGAGKNSRFDRSKLPQSTTSRHIARFSGRAPFANALRPNLTGGAMPRTAGGYSLGGTARYFSHTPAAPAQVVQNVSQAMRAFFLSGQKLRYDGVGPRGEAKYRAVSNLEDTAMRKLAAIPKSAPGSYLDFQLNPTLTALSPLAAAITYQSEVSGFKADSINPTLGTEGFLDALSADFGRALKDLTAVYGDLQRLSLLGDLCLVLEGKNTLRVRFPGVDAQTLERLCDDLGIQRGCVSQDADFDVATGVAVALKFPFAPDSHSPVSSPGGSARSLEGHEFEELSSLSDKSFLQEAFANGLGHSPWASEPEEYESMSPLNSGEHCSGEFEGLEGIYRFLEECDHARGRLG